MDRSTFTTPGGIVVTRTFTNVPFADSMEDLLARLETRRGFYLSSGYEYPGRYSRWDIASVCPPLEVVGRGRSLLFRPLNQRGALLCQMLFPILESHPDWESLHLESGGIRGILKPLPVLFPEEQRSKQPSAFTILRRLIDEFRAFEDAHLALVGAFGYDLLFQFDPIPLKHPRENQNDLHLFLCDDIYFVDRRKEVIERWQYDFEYDGASTMELERDGKPLTTAPGFRSGEIQSDHTAEQYMANVEMVREGMRKGDYYEVVLRRTFSTEFDGSTAELFRRLQRHSPSPYEFFLQFGEEQLIGASPEIFIRAANGRIETCPISGTAVRTGDPMRDAQNIRELLVSAKEESELTMCTDVDRNDKSRVCVPGSVRVIGRRLIESYAGVFHTVDHVEGMLAPGFDALDAFLSHMWSVTMIGAPKRSAALAIEELERSSRGWYGGAIGMLSLNGDMNTGITIRTVHLRDGIASYNVGATLLYDSVPEMEERETRQKASAFFRALGGGTPKELELRPTETTGRGIRLLLVDNNDCFIHTLSNYARQTGAEVVTYRAGFPLSLLEEIRPDLVLVSPGPGRPEEFGVPALVSEAARRGLPVFGVCLGLQGMVEAFGGELGILPYPMHGKPSTVRHDGQGVFTGLPEEFIVGRYHSLYAIPENLPACLEATAWSEDGIIMGVRHKNLPLEAVQFHPESILSAEADNGMKLMENVLRLLPRRHATETAASTSSQDA
ncbi:MAG: anthranilate synthase component I [Bryobacterales bacterium]|nr:anthranilate synthase component I [Bryobacterales bacterium]